MLRSMVRNMAVAAALIALPGCSDKTDPMFNEVAQVTVFSAVGYSVAVGQKLQLEGRAVTWSGTRVDERISSWKSSSPAVATVSSTGVVTGVSAGSTLITATAQGVASPDRLVNVTPNAGGVQ